MEAWRDSAAIAHDGWYCDKLTLRRFFKNTWGYCGKVGNIFTDSDFRHQWLTNQAQPPPNQSQVYNELHRLSSKRPQFRAWGITWVTMSSETGAQGPLAKCIAEKTYYTAYALQCRWCLPPTFKTLFSLA